jgi:hypothetical protein
VTSTIGPGRGHLGLSGMDSRSPALLLMAAYLPTPTPREQKSGRAKP